MKKYNRPLLNIETISILNSIANDVSGVKEIIPSLLNSGKSIIYLNIKIRGC